MTRIGNVPSLVRHVESVARPSAAEGISRPETRTLYRGMGLLELRMIVKYGVVVKFESSDNATFSYELDPCWD